MPTQTGRSEADSGKSRQLVPPAASDWFNYHPALSLCTDGWVACGVACWVDYKVDCRVHCRVGSRVDCWVDGRVIVGWNIGWFVGWLVA